MDIDQNNHNVFLASGSGTVWRVAYHPKRNFVASASNDAVLRLWKIDSNRQAAVELRGHVDAVFSVDINLENGDIASGSADGTVRLWEEDAPLSPKLLCDATSIAFISDESLSPEALKYYSGAVMM